MRITTNASTFLVVSFCCIEAYCFQVEPVKNPNVNRVKIDTQSSSHTSTELYSLPRRNVLGGALGAAIFGSDAWKSKASAAAPVSVSASSSSSSSSSSVAASPVAATEPLADLPMVRLRLPQNGFGREYVAIKLKINGQGPFDFMVDSGLTTELITPHLQETLGIQRGSKSIAGLAAGGDTAVNSIVELNGASLCCGQFASDFELPLPNLHAVITDFPQEHIDPAHDPVEGMIGMEVLARFDVDFDFPNNRIRFWEKGTANKFGMVEIPAVEINETGLIGIRLSVPGATQPILGFLDCGASFTCMNWKGATQLGFPPKNDPIYKKMPSIAAIGVDGRMIQLPTTKQTISFAGEVQVDPSTGRPSGFAAPPSEWKDWDPVQLAIGDIPAFSTILGDGITPYQGPAALIGLDVLAQRRVILEAGDGKSRRRRVFVAPE